MFLKSKKISVFAPCKGEVIPLDNVPDEVFSGRILGDGCAVDSKDEMIYAPIDGEITMVSDTYHAYAIRAKEGFEILVHIGIDTVKLKGDGFIPHVQVSQKISVGDPLVSVDFEKISKKGFCTFTILVVSPHPTVQRVEITNTIANKNSDEIFVIIRK